MFLASFSAALAVSLPAMAQEKGEEREATLRVVHLSPDAPELDAYVDGEPIGALSGVSFETVSSYLPLPAGTRNIKVYPASASDPLLEADVDLDGGSSYTLGVVGRLEDGSLAAKLYKDDNSPPAPGKTKVRMIHAVPDLGAATVRLQGREEDSVSLPGFSNASNYAELPAGTYALKARGKVKTAGTDKVTLSVPDVIFSTGEVYTIFVMGRVEDSSLGAGLTVDSRGGPPLLGTGGPPPAPAAEESLDNNPTVATPTMQEPTHDEATIPSDPIMAPPPDPDTLEPAYQERVYQQSLYQEEPFGEESFAITSVETEPAYRQPTSGLAVQDVPATIPDTIGRATTMPNTLSGGSGDDTTVLDTATDDDVAVVRGSLSGQEPSQITGGAAHFASISVFSGQGDLNEGAGEGGTVAVVGTGAPLALSIQAPP